MKSFLKYTIAVLTIFNIWSCKKDNYDPPKSTLTGKLVYKGEAIGVEYDRVPVQLYEYGFGALGSINGTFDQDGSYSFLLFDGEYKLIIPNNQGPFKPKVKAAGVPDSMNVSLKGNQTIDVEVIPYYMIRDPKISLASGKVTGTFRAEKIVVDASAKDIETVYLYINKTQYVSGADQIAQSIHWWCGDNRSCKHQHECYGSGYNTNPELCICKNWIKNKGCGGSGIFPCS